MFDGLIDLLKEFFCWILNFLVDFLYGLLSTLLYIFPSWPVPEFLQSGLENTGYFFESLNWVFPLGVIGPLFSMMFSFFVVYFILLPFYRGIMDLL